MNDVGELKQYVLIHARAQGMPAAHCQDVLDRIHTDDDGPGSWAHEWLAAGERHESAGNLLDACRDYGLARFPFTGTELRSEAARRGVAAFDRWRAGNSAIQPLTVDLPTGPLRCLATGLDENRPLLLVMGGIVSVKEQWAQVLLNAPKLGMAVVVAEMPGVGENTSVYRADSWQQISGLIDALAGRADVSQSYALSLSFSGHLLLRCALHDSRVKGIVTSGAPIHDFFTDADWLTGQVPRITLDTLSHLMAVKTETLAENLAGWELTPAELSALRIPVHYLVSRRDEIIPPAEPVLLRRHVADLRLAEHDDVHGSPDHFAESRLWIAHSLLRMRDVRGPQRAALAVMLGLARARAKLRGSSR